MLKINSLIPKSTKRYILKNTVQKKIEKNTDLALLGAVGVTTQVARIASWDVQDIAITSFFATLFVKSFVNLFKNRLDYNLIKKRAVSIKKASKI